MTDTLLVVSDTFQQLSLPITALRVSEPTRQPISSNNASSSCGERRRCQSHVWSTASGVVELGTGRSASSRGGGHLGTAGNAVFGTNEAHGASTGDSKLFELFANDKCVKANTQRGRISA